MLLPLPSILLSGNRKKRRKELDNSTEVLPAKRRKRRHAKATAHHFTETDGETVADCTFLGSKITADGDCSHGIKRRLLLGRKVMANLDSILKSKDITL